MLHYKGNKKSQRKFRLILIINVTRPEFHVNCLKFTSMNLNIWKLKYTQYNLP